MCVKSVIISLVTGVVLLTLVPCPVHAADPDDYTIRWAKSRPSDDLPAAHLAPNPAHGFDASIASDRVRLRPHHGDWTMDLMLRRVGREGALREVEPAGVETRGPRAELHRGNLVEWYRNDERGLEQGFTVRERPASAAGGPLVLELALAGDLVPLLAADGQRVNLLQPGERLAVLVYGSLAVVDDGNREVPARMELVSGTGETTLRILVDDGNATYPLTVDPLLATAAWTSRDFRYTSTVAWGDWDGDGDLDLAGGNENEPNYVYENTAGNLVAAWTSDESDDTRSVAWGDWDGDGDLDLAVGNYGQPNRVYENRDGGLASVWTSTESDQTYSVAWGDWDDDGDLDLAAANYSQYNCVYENIGGGLGPIPVWTSDDSDKTTSVAWGDWDGDGDIDLAAGNDGQPNRVYENIGGGTLASAWTSEDPDPTKPDPTYSVAWGDWDGDGDLDLAAGNYHQPNRVYENSGGGLALAWNSNDSDGTRSVAWGDWNGDGDLDLAAGNWGRSRPSLPPSRQPNRVYENIGGALTSAWTADDSDPTHSVTWGDWDGDGDLDLAAGNRDEPNRVYQNTGGALASVWTSNDSDFTNSVAWGDWDGDGDLDLAAGNGGEGEGQPNRVYQNTGDGLNPDPVWISNELDDTRSVAWGDWDGDGDLDLAAGNWTQPNRVYENIDGALDADAAWSSPELDDTTSVAWGDWDGDGDLDLAVGNAGPNRVYENRGGDLASAWTANDRKRTWSVAWGDWDSDGDLDLAAGNGYQPNDVYQNSGTGLDPTAVWTSADSDKTLSVAWGDWDGDGDLDLAAGNRGGGNRVYENTGGELASAWIASDYGDTYSVAWGDWDGDGDADLAAGNAYYSGKLNRVYENGVLQRPGGLPETPVSPVISRRPGTTAVAFFHSAEEFLQSPIEISYTLVDDESDPARRIKAEYSLTGGGSWHPATGSWIGGAEDVSASPGGESHVFFWDSKEDEVYRADSVVFRITVPYQASTRAAGPIQRAAMSAVSPPFRICEPAAGLSITKTDGRKSILPGETNTYTITVTNPGPAEIIGAKLTDAFPEELIDVIWSCVGFGGGTCNPPAGTGDIDATVNLPVGASVTCTAECTVDPAATGKLKNEACAPFDNCATDVTWVEIAPPLVETLILAHPDRMGLGPEEADSLLDELWRLAFHLHILGRVIDLGDYPELSGLYIAWDGNPENAVKANAVLFAQNGIHDLILDKWHPPSPRLGYLILVGGDPVIPFARFADDTLVPESRYTDPDPENSLWGLSADGTTVGQALTANKYLSDDPLGSVRSRWRPPDLDNPDIPEKLFLPDLAVGRLVESPEDVRKVIEAFINQQGVLDLRAVESGHKVLVSGFHFLFDGAKLNRNKWKAALQDDDSDAHAVVNEILMGDYWNDADLKYNLCGRHGPPYRVANLNGHATHWELGVPGYDPVIGFHGLATSELVDPNACGVDQPLDLSGNLVYVPGCHAGLPVPNTEPEGEPLDLPEALASLGAAAYLGNTGFGWGLKCGVGYSEMLLRMFTEELVKQEIIRVGEAVNEAKLQYFTESLWMDEYDWKTLRQWALSGIPNLELQTRGPVLPAPGSELSDESGAERVGPVTVERRLSTSSAADAASGREVDPDLPPDMTRLDLHFDFTADGVYTKYRATGEVLEGVEGCPGGDQPDPDDQLKCTGCYYTLNGLKEMTTGEANLPIQPYFVYDSHLSGVVQRGQLWKGVTYEREEDWVPAFGTLTSDGVIEVDPAVFPQVIYIKPTGPNLPTGDETTSVTSYLPTTPEHETVVFTTAEVEHASPGDLAYSLLKLHRTVDFELFYLPEAQVGTGAYEPGPNLPDPPHTQVDGTWVHWAVQPESETGVWRVVVVYDDGTLDADGRGQWVPLELTDDGTGIWRGSLEIPGFSQLTYFLQAVDKRGNASWLEFEVTTSSGIIRLPWPVQVTADYSDLKMDLYDDPDPVMVNDSLTYRMRVENLGPRSATAVNLSLMFSEDLYCEDLTGVGWTCSGPGKPGSLANCTLDGLSVGPVSHLSVECSAPSTPGLITATATVTAEEDDPHPENNTDGEETTVIDQSMFDLAVVKEGETVFTPGQPLSYTITVTNNGPAEVTGAIVTDDLPLELTDVEWECRATDDCSCGAVSGEEHISQVVDLYPDCEVVYIVDAHVPVGTVTPIENTASVAAPVRRQGDDYNPHNNSSTVRAVPSAVIFGDGFESGDFSEWSRVTTGKVISSPDKAPGDDGP